MDDNTPIDVNSDITPITKQKIEHIQADKWPEMTPDELYDQKYILQQRLYGAAQLGNHSLMMAIEQGIAQIDAVIYQKTVIDTVKLI